MKILKLGTRSSKMALYQANIVKNLLLPYIQVEIIPMVATGDLITGNLAKHGGKGTFVSKLDEALVNGEIDITVNCLKDIPNDKERTNGIKIAAVLKRDDSREALLCGPDISEVDLLRGGFIIGTSSPRRKAILKKMYPNCKIEHFRGSSDTRIDKLLRGDVDAIVLAKCGLGRISSNYKIERVYDTKIFPPAIGSGVITIDCLENSLEIGSILSKINNQETFTEVLFERALVNNLRGNCNTSISLDFEYFGKGKIKGAVILYSSEGNDIEEAFEGSMDDPIGLGFEIAMKMIQKGAKEIIETGEWF